MNNKLRDRNERMGILVTGTGGGAGQSILKTFQDTDYRVIAADGEVLGTGLYTTGKGYVIPYANSPSFIERLLSICRTEGVRLLFPGLDAELPVLARERELFAKHGVTVVVSDESVVSICDDKLATADFLKSQGLPSARTWTLSDYTGDAVPFPLILKPKIGGARSKGVRMVTTAADLAKARAEMDGTAFVAQEMIDGPEYTCGTITLDGHCMGAIVMRRVLRDGDTYKAFVERDLKLEEFVADVANRLQSFGPCNMQLRVRDGIPYIFEFNGRCSGTTYCRALAGFNEPRMIADFILNGTKPAFEVRPITVLRYWKELVVENETVAGCEATREVNVRVGLL
jgi:carbamoyl-phosphate synthase large subunit